MAHSNGVLPCTTATTATKGEGHAAHTHTRVQLSYIIVLYGWVCPECQQLQGAGFAGRGDARMVQGCIAPPIPRMDISPQRNHGREEGGGVIACCPVHQRPLVLHRQRGNKRSQEFTCRTRNILSQQIHIIFKLCLRQNDHNHMWMMDVQ